jgi:steroid delta-isomerase-like uncharacterized protein
MVVITLGLALAAGCTKKDKDKKTGMTGSAGSAAVAKPDEGSAAVKPPEPPKPTPKTGKDLAQAYLDCVALNSGAKWDEFMTQCIAEGAVVHMADDEDMKRDEIVPMEKDMRATFPDAKFQPQLLLVNERNVLGVSLIVGTHEGPMKTPMGEIPATKKKFGTLLYQRLAFNDENKVTEEWVYLDPATMMGQLGLSPKEAPPSRPVMEKGMEGAPEIVVAAGDDKEKQNLETVKKSNEAFAGKKGAESMAPYADDAVESDQAGGADAKGKKEIEKGMKVFWKAFPDLKLEVPNMWAAGDYVVVEGTFSGTNSGPLGKMPKTGKKVTSQFAEVFKLKDGKITQVWRFRNGMAMAAQLGLGGEPPKGGDMKGGDMKGGDMKKGAEPAKTK